MAPAVKPLRLVALNIDGVLLNDTFSPVIHDFITSRGGVYTAEVERRIFSQPQSVASREMAVAIGQDLSSRQILDLYFEERDAYLVEYPVELMDGAVELIGRIRRLGLATVCYGGLSKSHFDEHLGAHAALFDGPGYVCTNDFRPGIREIAEDVFGLGLGEVLFIDDVARVAEAARALDTPFIGHPSSFAGSFQPQLMREAGVRHLVGSLHEIDEDLLTTVAARAAAGESWPA